ncbi:MAG TPA: hypothetical protein VF681_07700 [Abditibacteriaceae bacterium]|jgi:hypothetical protein
MNTRIKRSAAALCFAASWGLAPGSVHAQNAAATVSVDVSKNRRAINPNIYGVSFASREQLAALNCPLNRWGGNAASRHNWQPTARAITSTKAFPMQAPRRAPPLIASSPMRAQPARSR